MVSKNRQPGIGQDALFALDTLNPVNTETGVSVSRVIRAQHLLNTLDLLGQSRRLDGFTIATSHEPNNIHRMPIVQRYGNVKTDAIRSSAIDRKAQALDSAKWQFAFATGYMALKGAGLLSEEDIKRDMRDDFAEFEDTYFGSKEADKNRNKFRRRLQKDIG